MSGEFSSYQREGVFQRLSSRFKGLPLWVRVFVYSLPVVVVLEAYIILGGGGFALGSTVSEPLGFPKEEVVVAVHETEIFLEEKFSEEPTRVQFYERVGVRVKEGGKATGYRMAVPSKYRVPFGEGPEVPLNYRLLGNGKINGHETLPELSAPLSNFHHFLSLKTGVERPIRSAPEENLFEVGYEVSGFPLIDEKSGRGYFSWVFPSPSRPVHVERARFLVVLPGYAVSDEVTVLTQRVQYEVTPDGFADESKFVLSSPEEGGVHMSKTTGVVGRTSRVQVVLQAKELKPFEAVQLLVRW